MLYWFLFGDVTAGLIVGAAWWIAWGRRRGFTSKGLASSAAIAGLVGVLGELCVRLLGGSWGLLFGPGVPGEVSLWILEYRYVYPLVLGLVALLALALPLRTRATPGSADLTRRSLLTYARPWWLIAAGVLLVLVLALTVGAGALSEPDELGRYTAYTINGGVAMASTAIYGWYYSVPAMVLIAVVIVMAAVDLWLISRPPLGADPEGDRADRRLRSRNVVTVLAGALFVHLSVVLNSLHGTSSISLMGTTTQGPAVFWSTFSALGPTLAVGAFITMATGIALWTIVATSGLRVRNRDRELQRS